MFRLEEYKTKWCLKHVISKMETREGHTGSISTIPARMGTKAPILGLETVTQLGNDFKNRQKLKSKALVG